MNFNQLEHTHCENKRVLVRVDLNVPIHNGKILSDARINAIIPTLEYLLKEKACIILVSHLGRPEEGVYDEKLSLKIVAAQLSNILNYPVRFERNWLNGLQVAPKEIVMVENVRFNIGESSNNLNLAKKMANLCDIFVMDAFGTAHRAHASTVGITHYAPLSVAGLLLSAELKALTQAFLAPKKPVVAIIGGAKVSSKLKILQNLLEKIDTLIVGGGIANTFLSAKGYNIGSSLHEPMLLEEAKKILLKAEQLKVNILLPQDVVVSNEINTVHEPISKRVDDIKLDEKIFDVGPISSRHYEKLIKEASTIIWNGPMGVFEIEAFSQGTKKIAIAIANSSAFSIAGGGETLAAIEKYNIEKQISYISTGGGAFLEYLEGKQLPGIAALQFNK